MRVLLVAFLAGLLGLANAVGQQSGAVEKKGQTATTKLEHPVSGHLTELNGKYKLRVSEVIYEPGGYIGEHHHAGPGIRMVTEGELTYIEAGKTTIYKPGDYFYESGDMSHTVYNKTNAPVRLVNFEILPADWNGGSAIPIPMTSH